MRSLLESLEPYNDVIGETDRSYIDKLWRNQQLIARQVDLIRKADSVGTAVASMLSSAENEELRNLAPPAAEQSLIEAVREHLMFNTPKTVRDLREAVEREEVKDG